ncbi:MAG: hypothetical protein ACYC61_06335 [Isosphaeraceae bacterium]
MGEMSKRLHRKLTMLAPPGDPIRPRRGWRPQSPAPDIARLIADGFDPIHAAYLFVHHITSVFSENVSRFPELRAYAQEVGRAEEEYMPSGPPMSPLTRSYFSCWAFFDHRIGATADTLAGCLIEANDAICLNPHQLGALEKMSRSRMGIYEHRGVEGGHVRLRELVTDREFVCHSASGYRGKPGELWYVRLMPPLEPELATYHVVFTTPYMLIGQSKGDWIASIKRNVAGMSESSEEDALHQLFKYGRGNNYWNEFIFRAYHHHQPDAIFLTGIPDLKATLPHA